MMNSLNNALEHTLAMTHHVMRGRVIEIEQEGDPSWLVMFRTDEGSIPTRKLEVEVFFQDGGVVAGVLNEFNMTKSMLNTFMDIFMSAIVIPDEEPEPDLENEDPDDYETEGE
jgi:hypothetical protein